MNTFDWFDFLFRTFLGIQMFMAGCYYWDKRKTSTAFELYAGAFVMATLGLLILFSMYVFNTFLKLFKAD